MALGSYKADLSKHGCLIWRACHRKMDPLDPPTTPALRVCLVISESIALSLPTDASDALTSPDAAQSHFDHYRLRRVDMRGLKDIE